MAGEKITINMDVDGTPVGSLEVPRSRLEKLSDLERDEHLFQAVEEWVLARIGFQAPNWPWAKKEAGRVKFKHLPTGLTTCELFTESGDVWLGKSWNADRKAAKREAEADARQRMAEGNWFGE